jgi:hypothetical protein
MESGSGVAGLSRLRVCARRREVRGSLVELVRGGASPRGAFSRARWGRWPRFAGCRSARGRFGNSLASWSANSLVGGIGYEPQVVGVALYGWLGRLADSLFRMLFFSQRLDVSAEAWRQPHKKKCARSGAPLVGVAAGGGGFEIANPVATHRDGVCASRSSQTTGLPRFPKCRAVDPSP